MICFTIVGEPASKANSRQIVTINGRPSSIKSKKARNYEAEALMQIPPAARVRLEGPVRVTLRIWYASERPDLDESVVLDVLQDRYKSVKLPEHHCVSADGMHTMHQAEARRELVQSGVYRNDRQVREKHVFHAIDRRNPRVEVVVEPLQAQQIGLAAA